MKWNTFTSKCLYKTIPLSMTALLCFSVVLSTPLTAFATEDYQAAMEERKTLPIQSNEIKNWPEGPAIGAQAAILMEMKTHTILYAKNIHEELYPASTTKIMTCLLAAQNCSLDDQVTFSHDAVYSVPSDGSNMGMDEGESITLEQAMYGVLVGSANEAASAVGEHVAASLQKEATVDAFCDIMNQKADELGCENTHFTNANGLFDENHYTSAYDLALIGCEFFQNEILCKMSSTINYHIPATDTQPDDIWINSKNKLYTGRSHEYEYLLGSKTGFVSQSRQTLVSGAEKDGMKLVCVIFMEETPYQYEDTIALFEYGFQNFQQLMIGDYETQYTIHNYDLFSTGDDLFGNSTPLLSMDEDAFIVLPNFSTFADAKSSIQYSKEQESEHVASIQYSYYDVPVGSCNIVFSKAQNTDINFATNEIRETDSSLTALDPENEVSSSNENNKVIFINVKLLILGALGAALLIWLIISLISFISSYNFSPRGQSSKRRRERGKEKRLAKRNSKAILYRQKQLQKRRKRAYRKRNNPSRKTYD